MSSSRHRPKWMADIGNSRMKWACLDENGRFRRSVNLPLDDRLAWIDAWEREAIEPASCWAIASVNPPVAASFGEFLGERGVTTSSLFDSAAKVPVSNSLEEPSRSGADRALAVLAATAIGGQTGPGLVISCGSAITVERITAEGVWEGGAIAAGLPLAARALHQSTAQLPWVPALEPVPPWGNATTPAIAAGVFWGTVGTVRELTLRQEPSRWRYWTGGDAEVLAQFVEPLDGRHRVISDLVLRGLALAAFQSTAEEVGL